MGASSVSTRRSTSTLIFNFGPLNRFSMSGGSLVLQWTPFLVQIMVLVMYVFYPRPFRHGMVWGERGRPSLTESNVCVSSLHPMIILEYQKVDQQF